MENQMLTLDGFVEEVKEASTGRSQRKFCFILGAGASITSGIKTGQQLVEIWDSQLRMRNANMYDQWKAKHEVTDENKYSHYSNYYENAIGDAPQMVKTF